LFSCKLNPEAANQQESAVKDRLSMLDQPVAVVLAKDGEQKLVGEGEFRLDPEGPDKLLAVLPAVSERNLGSSSFRLDHGLEYNYIAGAMANGIGSEEIVIAMGKAGMLGFFGSGGLHPRRVEEAILRIQSELKDGECYGFNLLHNPFEPTIEEQTVDMYHRYGIHRVSAAAYLGLTKYIVHYRLKGLHRDSNGQVVAKNHVFAKVSRSEVARKFMAPAPQKMVDELLQEGKITEEEAELSQWIPMAQDITAEADSGGHTDNRPLVTLLPTFLTLRDQAMAEFKYNCEIRVGAAGGISTPQSVACAFAMGADYVVTGSVNQGTLEAGTSDYVREALTRIEPHDVGMAPAADMFEMGVELQVLQKGSMFAMRARKLYQLYQDYKSIEEIPAAERQKVEKQIFQKSLDEVWKETETFFLDRDPEQITKAQVDSKHKMALIFRWYLGKSSIWAIQGVENRRMDYQIWAGPSMGAFNEWTRGSFLQDVKERKVVQIARNLLYGTAYLNRLNQLKALEFPLGAELSRIEPKEIV